MLIVYWFKLNLVVAWSRFGLFRRFLLRKVFVMVVLKVAQLLFGLLSIGSFRLFLLIGAVRARGCFRG